MDRAFHLARAATPHGAAGPAPSPPATPAKVYDISIPEVRDNVEFETAPGDEKRDDIRKPGEL